MYTPHVITLVNVTQNADLTLSYNLTVLDGVFLEPCKARNASKTGLNDADAVTLYIPFSTLGKTTAGTAKEYKSPKAYDALTDKSGYWTLKDDGDASNVDCFFIKGTVTSVTGYASARNTYDYVYAVTKVDLRDFGSADMQHYQVSGR